VATRGHALFPWLDPGVQVFICGRRDKKTRLLGAALFVYRVYTLVSWLSPATRRWRHSFLRRYGNRNSRGGLIT